MLHPDRSCPTCRTRTAPRPDGVAGAPGVADGRSSSPARRCAPATCRPGRRATATPSSCCPASSPGPSRRSSCAATCAGSATAPTTGARAATSAPARARRPARGPPARDPRPLRAPGEPGRLERRRHLRPRDGPGPARPHPLGHHPRQPVPGAPGLDPRLDDVPPHEPPPPGEDVHRRGPRRARRHRCAVPTTCVYSRHDGIVAWECCLSRARAPHREHRGHRHPPRLRPRARDAARHRRPARPARGSLDAVCRAARRRSPRRPGREPPDDDHGPEHGRPRAAGRSDRRGRSRWASPLDSIFLMGETNETLMHVGSMLHFTYPRAGSAPISSASSATCAPPRSSRRGTCGCRPGCSCTRRCTAGSRTRPSTSTTTCGTPRCRPRAASASSASSCRDCTRTARLPPAAVGAPPHRGPRRAPVRHLLQDPPLAGRRLHREAILARPSTDPDDREHPFFFSTRQPPGRRDTARGRLGGRVDPQRLALVGGGLAVGAQALARPS